MTKLFCIIPDCNKEAMFIYKGNSLCGTHKFEVSGGMPT